MGLTRAFNKDYYDAEKQIIIYGASVYGELAYHGLQCMDIKPDYYCDRARGGIFKYPVNCTRWVG